jgi:hypothetical protein
MARSGYRALTRNCAFLLGLLAAGGACTTVQAPEPAPAFEAGVELPRGPGRDLLVSACLSCHELVALGLFKGFYTHESWRSLLLTMKGYGADVDDAEIELLADYLTQHFSPSAR